MFEHDLFGKPLHTFPRDAHPVLAAQLYRAVGNEAKGAGAETMVVRLEASRSGHDFPCFEHQRDAHVWTAFRNSASNMIRETWKNKKAVGFGIYGRQNIGAGLIEDNRLAAPIGMPGRLRIVDCGIVARH